MSAEGISTSKDMTFYCSYCPIQKGSAITGAFWKLGDDDWYDEEFHAPGVNKVPHLSTEPPPNWVGTVKKPDISKAYSFTLLGMYKLWRTIKYIINISLHRRERPRTSRYRNSGLHQSIPYIHPSCDGSSKASCTSSRDF